MFNMLSSADKLGVAVFFVGLGLALVILLLIYRCAGKFLHGDYYDQPHDLEEAEEEDEEDHWRPKEIYVQCEEDKETELEQSGMSERKVSKGSLIENIHTRNFDENDLLDEDTYYEIPEDERPTLQTKNESSNISVTDIKSSNNRGEKRGHKITNHNASIRSQGNIVSLDSWSETPHRSLDAWGLSVPRGSVATISVLLEQKPALNRLYGCIQAIYHVRMQEPPDVVCFHVKITPQRKPRTRSEWKDIRSDPFDVDFSLRPLKHTVDPESSVCIRMYGKKRRSGISKEVCCGECYVSVSRLIRAGGIMQAQLYLSKKL